MSCRTHRSLSFLRCSVLGLALLLSGPTGGCGSDAAVDDIKSPSSSEDEPEDETTSDEESEDDESAITFDDPSEAPVDAGKKRDASASNTSPGVDAGAKDAGNKPASTPDSAVHAPVDAGAPVPPVEPNGATPAESKLPKPKGACPTLKNGSFNIAGTSGTMWVGSKPGPMLFYWHGTGGSASEVDTGLPGATGEVRSNGGIVASFETTNGTGDNTGNAVWFTGDFEAADQILACGIEKGLVDTARIFSSGYSAGGLQTGAMVFARSNYLASAVVYSGGPALGGLVPGSTTLVDKTNVPAVLGAHGAQGSDWLALDFSDGTKKLESAIVMAGGFAIDCDDGGSHLDFFTIRAGVGNQAWPFLKAHPYNTKPSPYAGALPSGFPRYCQIVK